MGFNSGFKGLIQLSSWGWAQGRSKHVEDLNKYIIEEIVRQVGYLPELYEDVGSEKYLKNTVMIHGVPENSSNLSKNCVSLDFSIRSLLCRVSWALKEAACRQACALNVLYNRTKHLKRGNTVS